ncbi:transcription initiation factor IIA large subunit-like isoform X2 [Aristolochia californica]|uniref:transcription initiation factor IIA large subunit-like isoform X2 n=1 Tax=Aristolochia californica TaxID=171875 RepID=UPI0035E01925
MAASVSSVYLHVVDSVVSKLRQEFTNEGVDDSVLNELQSLWELKMLQCGAIQGPIERNPASRAHVPTPVRDLNVPYEGPEEYETPTAEMLFPPTPLQTPIPTPLPVEPVAYQYFPPAPSEYGIGPDDGTLPEAKGRRPPAFLQPSQSQSPSPSPSTSTCMNQRPLGVDVNVAYDEAREEEGGGGGGITQPPMKDFFTSKSGKRKREDLPPHFLPSGYIPQQDGSGDDILGRSLQEKVLLVSYLNKESIAPIHDRLSIQNSNDADAAVALVKLMHTTRKVPQKDGQEDVYENGLSNEEYNTGAYYDPLTPHTSGTPKMAKGEALEDEEPPLNEDDDDDDLDDLEGGDEELNTSHLVLAQFEKVNRTKSRWKCTLKDGIMRLNNRDIMFTKATGEFDF